MVRTISKYLVIAALVGVASCADGLGSSGQEPEQAEPADDDTANPDAARPSGGKAGTASLVGTGPIAYGAVLADGTKMSGTSNWTSTFNAALDRIEVTISGESYFYLDYATVVTPLGDIRYCRTGSISGKLTIYCHDSTGAAAASRIAFVVSRP